jgi:uncharacterized protein
LVEFEWDPAKSATEQRRGIGFDRAAEIFLGCLVEWPNDRKPYGKQCIRTVGETSGELLHVVYADNSTSGAAV